MDPLISVIMSTYNEKMEWIKRSVNSILNQTYKNIEFIIIVDNPTNQKLINLLKKYQESDNRIKLIINKQNMGLVKSLNIALEHCRGTYIARMDADDIADVNRLNIQKEFLEKHDLDFVFSSMMLIDEGDNPFDETNRAELTSIQVKRALEISNVATHPTWFLKKEVYDSLNGYRDVPYCEDYDFSLRSLQKGFRIGKVNQNLLKYRIRTNGISHSNALEQYLNARGILSLYKKKQLDNDRLVNDLIRKTKKQATVIEKENFSNARVYLSNGLALIKRNKKIKGVLEILKSTFTSKYHTLKNIDLISYKIKSKINLFSKY